VIAKVIGIGGIFFRSENPKALQAWYHEHLGFPRGDDDHPMAVFRFDEDIASGRAGYAIWSPFAKDTTYFDPSHSDYMINFRVDDLEGLLSSLKDKGVKIVDGPKEEPPYGTFAWIIDPEGSKIELWEPPEIQE